MLMFAAGACVAAAGLLLLATLSSAKPLPIRYVVPIPLAASVAALQSAGGAAPVALLIAVGVVAACSTPKSRSVSAVVAVAVGSLAIICNIIQPVIGVSTSWEPAALGGAAALSVGLSFGLGLQLVGQSGRRVSGAAAVAALLAMLGFLNKGLPDLQVAGLVGFEPAVVAHGGLLIIAACVVIVVPVTPQLRWPKLIGAGLLIAATAGLIVVSGNSNGADLARAWPTFGGLICALGLIVAADAQMPASDGGPVGAIVSLALCMALLGLWGEFWAHAPGYGPTALILALLCSGGVALTNKQDRSWTGAFGAALCVGAVGYSLWFGHVEASWIP